MDGAHAAAEEAIRAAATAYCEALHRADGAALEAIFHPASHLYASQHGALIEWPREHFVARVAARTPTEGPAQFGILSVDMAGPEMAAVKLWVQLPERRYTDYLNFLLLDGEWRVIAKLFRVADGPLV